MMTTDDHNAAPRVSSNNKPGDENASEQRKRAKTVLQQQDTNESVLQQHDHDCKCRRKPHKGLTKKPVDDLEVQKCMREYFKAHTGQEAVDVVGLHMPESEFYFMPVALLARNATHIVCIACTGSLHSDTICSVDVRNDVMVQKVLEASWSVQAWAKHAHLLWPIPADF